MAEIVLPTQGLTRTYDPISKTYKQDGLIALCNLSGINFGAFDDPKDLARVAYVTMRAVDNLLVVWMFVPSKSHVEM